MLAHGIHCDKPIVESTLRCIGTMISELEALLADTDANDLMLHRRYAPRSG